MNATMLAELKKRQSSESADQPEPAPRLSSAAAAAAPGRRPAALRPRIHITIEAAPLDDARRRSSSGRSARRARRRGSAGRGRRAGRGRLPLTAGSAVADQHRARGALAGARRRRRGRRRRRRRRRRPRRRRGRCGGRRRGGESGDAAAAGGWEPAASGAAARGLARDAMRGGGRRTRRNSVRKRTHWRNFLTPRRPSAGRRRVDGGVRLPPRLVARAHRRRRLVADRARARRLLARCRVGRRRATRALARTRRATLDAAPALQGDEMRVRSIDLARRVQPEAARRRARRPPRSRRRAWGGAVGESEAPRLGVRQHADGAVRDASRTRGAHGPPTHAFSSSSPRAPPSLPQVRAGGLSRGVVAAADDRQGGAGGGGGRRPTRDRRFVDHHRRRRREGGGGGGGGGARRASADAPAPCWPAVGTLWSPWSPRRRRRPRLGGPRGGRRV